jgi:DNA-binding protein H-NS
MTLVKTPRTAVAKSRIVEPTQTLKEIDLEIAKLKERAASIVANEKAGVVERIKEAIAYYGITPSDLGFGGAAKGTRGTGGRARRASPEAVSPSAETVPVKKGRAGAGIIKFKDDAGNAWSGFGPKPRWLTEALAAGKTIEELKVQ